MATDREKELETILKMMAEGLRGKARVLQNKVSAPYTDPVRVLLTAAHELETAAGGKLQVSEQQSVNHFMVDELDLVVGDQVTTFGGEWPVAKVEIDIRQETVAIHAPVQGEPFGRYPKSLHMRLTIKPSPSTTQQVLLLDPPKSPLH